MRRLFGHLLAALALCAACGSGASGTPLAPPDPDAQVSVVPPAGPGRRLCLALTPSPGQLTLDDAFATASALGMTEPGDINIDWGRLEPRRDQLVDPDGELAMFNTLYADVESATMTLAPIQTTYVSVPADLEGRAWNDPELVQRYLIAVDTMLAALPDVEIRVVSVGNEVDGLLADDPHALAQFAELVAATNAHLDGRGIRVGSKLTWSGAQLPALRQILDASDLAIVSYYPLGVGADPWRVRQPDVVSAELDAIVEHVHPLPVYLGEVGYPSSPELGSSPQHQADFVAAVFDAWDRHPDAIDGACFVWLYDLSAETLDVLVDQYDLADPGFRAYLGSLGLHRSDGHPQPAVDVIRARAAAAPLD